MLPPIQQSKLYFLVHKGRAKIFKLIQTVRKCWLRGIKLWYTFSHLQLQSQVSGGYAWSNPNNALAEITQAVLQSTSVYFNSYWLIEERFNELLQITRKIGHDHSYPTINKNHISLLAITGNCYRADSLMLLGVIINF